MMDIFPAIDLKDGLCVRLQQGDFAKQTNYSDDPLAVAKKFEESGASWLHVVDLNGAQDGKARQTSIIQNILENTALSVQTGGGIREEKDVEILLDAGVSRVIIGSLAVKEPSKIKAWLKRFGGKHLVLALDVRLDDQGEPEVLTQGWQEGSGILMWDLLKSYEGTDLQTILCTDIARDGMLTGPNITLYKQIQNKFPALDLLASGGVGSLDDIRALAALDLKGVITGKALYENAFSLEEAIKEAAVC